jgi:hypothetical protein
MAGKREVTWEELLRAGTVLFGPGFATAIHGTGWREELRAAWHRRVLETHPDRAALLGRSEAALQREFRAVTEAFALLEAFAGRAELPSPPRAGPAVASPPRQARPPPPARREPPRPPRAPPPPAPPPPTATAAQAGLRLPRRRLRFAEFLYYSGRINWQHYSAALAWQRGQRPSIGRLAIDLGLLGPRDVNDLLDSRRREGAQAEPLGQFAVRRGLLTRPQVLGLVGRQARGQRRIGQYFIDKGLLTAAQLEGAQLALFGHNARYAAKVA